MTVAHVRGCATAVIASVLSLVACGGSEETSSTSTSGPVPLADAVATLEPRPVWQHFYELTQIPRTSGHEQQVTAFVADFGRRLGLDTTVDSAGNVLIREPATPGMEGRPGVVLQGHLDMVGEKTSESTIDFLTDPIQAVVENGWVHANGTSLGGDDGAGVAMILAVLESRDLVHGPIEALLTTSEEAGTMGIETLSPTALKGRSYINLDSEIEGLFVISSAGGVQVDARKRYEQVPPPAAAAGFQIAIGGLLGGHSGVDIDKGRGSAHQLLARLLVNAPPELEVRVGNVVGEDTYNAIPRDATAAVAVPASQADAFRAYVRDFGATVATELAATDPGVTVTATPAGVPPAVMEAAAQKALIGAVDSAPQGVYAMSTEMPGVVETSGNLGVLGISDGQFTAGAYARSAKDPECDAEAQRYVDVFEQAGATTETERVTSAWPPNPSSPLLARMEQVYTSLFGTPPTVTGVHAGLETGTVKAKYPDMDMISVGPTVENVHSPSERLQVSSVSKAYQLLVATLMELR